MKKKGLLPISFLSITALVVGWFLFQDDTPSYPPETEDVEIVWQIPCNGHLFTTTSDNGIAVAPDDTIYMTDRRTITVISPQGEILEQMRVNTFGTIASIAVSEDGTIWAAHGNVLYGINSDYEVFYEGNVQIKKSGTEDYAVTHIVDLALIDDLLYGLADVRYDENNHESRIYIWDNGKEVKHFSINQGDRDAPLVDFVTMGITPDNDLLLIDRLSNMAVMDTNGDVVTQGTMLNFPQDMGRLRRIAIAPDNTFFMALSLTWAPPYPGLDVQNHIYWFDENGEMIGRYGNHSVDEPIRPGDFFSPEGVATLSNGDLIVLDSCQVVRLSFPSPNQTET